MTLKDRALSRCSYGVLYKHFGPMDLREIQRVLNQAMFYLFAGGV